MRERGKSKMENKKENYIIKLNNGETVNAKGVERVDENSEYFLFMTKGSTILRIRKTEVLYIKIDDGSVEVEINRLKEECNSMIARMKYDEVIREFVLSPQKKHIRFF